MRFLECVVLVLALGQVSCGYALQVSSVRSSFAARFGCAEAVISSVSDGWHVEGCGRTAEYACIDQNSSSATEKARSASEFVAGVMVDAMFAGLDERCVLTSAEQTPLLSPVASDAPTHVQRLARMRGGPVIKAQTLFANGHVAALARPSLHPDHALLIVHTTARLTTEACALELRRDEEPVPLLQQARAGDYEQHAVIALTTLHELARASRVTGALCGIALDLDASGRSTLGVFAAKSVTERDRLRHPEAVAKQVHKDEIRSRFGQSRMVR